jgi:hypothetical protein
MTLPRKERKGTADANDGCSTATRLEVARPVQRTVRDLQLDGKVIVTSHEQIARLGLFAESDCLDVEAVGTACVDIHLPSVHEAVADLGGDETRASRKLESRAIACARESGLTHSPDAFAEVVEAFAASDQNERPALEGASVRLVKPALQTNRVVSTAADRLRCAHDAVAQQGCQRAHGNEVVSARPWERSGLERERCKADTERHRNRGHEPTDTAERAHAVIVGRYRPPWRPLNDPLTHA